MCKDFQVGKSKKEIIGLLLEQYVKEAKEKTKKAIDNEALVISKAESIRKMVRLA